MTLFPVQPDLLRRLPWLLLFKAAIATGLLALGIAIELLNWPVEFAPELLSSAVIGTYAVVAILATLVRYRVSAVAVSLMHLATSVLVAFLVVQGTGRVESVFAFLYLLPILDAAIIGGRRAAMFMALVAILVYGIQIVLQLYGIPKASLVTVPPYRFIGAFVAQLAASCLVAFLAGHLAELWYRAREAESHARFDLVRAEQLHTSVLESLPLGVITFDAKETVCDANPAAAGLLNLTQPQLIGHRLPEILQRFALADEVGDIEIALTDGPRWIRVTRSPFRQSSNGRHASDDPDLQILVLEDRTDLRALEHELVASARLASIGKLSAAIAHELRNPLAAISGSFELLSRETSDDASRERLKTIVSREIERLNKLVSEFLNYARPQVPQRLPTDIAALIRDTCEVLRSDETMRKHRIEIKAPDRVEAFVDASQMQQVLWNLLRNAMEASPVDCPIVVSVHNGAAGQIVLEIGDYGPGVSPDIREHLFEPFHTNKVGGTGLGLAVVRRIIDTHQGHIELKAEAPYGTVARITLPPLHLELGLDSTI